MLMEVDKCMLIEVLFFFYFKNVDEKIYIFENLYIIGMMNIVDCLFVLFDLVLCCCFVFIDLKLVFNDVWRNWVNYNYVIDFDMLVFIKF